MSKIALKPYACTLANVTRLVFETCDLTRNEQRDVLAYLYYLVAPGRETGWDMPQDAA